MGQLMAENNSLIEIHEGRKHIYYFLSRFFIDIPDENMYEQISSIIPAFSIITVNNMIKEGVIGLEHFTSKRNKTKGEERILFDNDILNDYSILFCQKDKVHLFQSEYLAPYNKTLKDELAYFYKQYGFEIEDNNNTDHISYQLSFMGYLSGMQALNLYKENNEMYNHLLQVQLEFINKYLMTYIHNFFKAVEKIPESALLYYAGAALITGFIEYDKSFLEKMINQ